MPPLILFYLVLYVQSSSVTPHSSALEQSLDDAVAELVANMTVVEKARQLVVQDGTAFVSNGVFNDTNAIAWLKHLGAGVLDSVGRNVDPSIWNSIQRAVVASSRHGIGAINAEECQHGVQGDWHTIFPSPYTVAAAFDTQLMGELGKVIGTEARAGGINQCWSPVCGLAREPRWGRAEEEMGEDPFLAGELAAAMVKGMIGGHPSNLTQPNTVSPLLKHFAAHSIPESGRNAAPVHIGRREYSEIFLPPFEKAVRAGAQGAMSSYNEVDGVPTSSDHWLLTEKMRGEFGFQGYISSDFGAISQLGPNTHAIAPDDEGSVKLFLEVIAL